VTAFLAGPSDVSAYSRARYGTPWGDAQGVLEILCALDLRNIVFVEHLPSATDRLGRRTAGREG
jgi:hypothetical protein